MLWQEYEAITEEAIREQATAPRAVLCPHCNGAGCHKCSYVGYALHHVVCPSCGGVGWFTVRVREPDGFWSDGYTEECGQCEGYGLVTEHDADMFYARMMEEAV